MRKIEKMDLITKGIKKYMTLDVIEYENKKYAFVNEVTNEEEVTQNYLIFEINGLETTTIIDVELLNKLLPIFQNNLEKDINNILKEEN